MKFSHGNLESAVCLVLPRERAGLSPEGALFCLSSCGRCGLRTRRVKALGFIVLLESAQWVRFAQNKSGFLSGARRHIFGDN